MLLEMRIENFILIEALNLSFDKGLNVFTGETGAGKSMIIGAINAGLGGKVSPDLIRKGADKAVIQLVFDQLSHEVHETLTSLGFNDIDMMIITREILPTNRSVVRLNDRVITLPTLRQLSDVLIDLHGQHEHQTLLYPKNHMKYLDLMGDKNHEQLINKVKAAYNDIKSVQKEIEELSISEKVDINYLKFQLNEIESLNLTDDDELNLENKYKYYKNLESIYANTNGVLQILSGEDQYGIKELLEKASGLLSEVSSFDDVLSKHQESITDILYQVDDIQSDIRRYTDNLEVDEQEMFEVEERMNAISQLKVKYGRTIEDILIKRDELAKQLEIATQKEDILESLNKKMIELKRVYVGSAKALQASRHKLKTGFEKQVVDELAVLNMKESIFQVHFVEKKLQDGEYRLSSNGFDEVEFMISTNPGMPVKPLAKIASGGEISRIMLAIKIALSKHDTINSLVFDEVDTGISGKTAIVVGEKIHKLTSDYQVLCITHLPQIAVMADRHFLINKAVSKGLGITAVETLNHMDQLTEIARMLSGTGSDTAKQNAKEMLEKAQVFKNIS